MFLVVLLAIGCGVLFGLLVGRWWALLVPLALAVLLYDKEAAPGNDLAGLEFAWAAIAAVGVVIGVAVRKLGESSDEPVAPS